jgi:hypothetical protein
MSAFVSTSVCKPVEASVSNSIIWSAIDSTGRSARYSVKNSIDNKLHSYDFTRT